LRPTECALGKEKRSFTSVVLMPDDSSFFVGTLSGDVIKIAMSSKRICNKGPTKKLMKGITAVRATPRALRPAHARHAANAVSSSRLWHASTLFVLALLTPRSRFFGCSRLLSTP